MTSISATRRAEGGAVGRLAERLVTALPLATVFVWFALVYAWQAWLVGTPTIFIDELKYTQIARSIAEAGALTRRGEGADLDSLVEVLTAPAWLVDDTETAYDLAKYIGVLAMTATVFPVYALARTLVSPPWALFAAVGSIATPALTYSSFLLEEPLAYAFAALTLFLIVRALSRRTSRAVVLAGGAAAVAPLVRGELAILPAVFALSGLAVAWTSQRGQRWRANWSAWDWVGVAALVAGAAILANAVVSHQSYSWEVATRNKDRMIELGLWAGGAFTIGLGIIPVLIALAALTRPREGPRSREQAAFIAVLGTSIAAFGFYTAVKAAFLSEVFSTRVAERNLIYLAPLLFVATAMWLERPRLRPVALASAAGAVLLMLATMPIVLDFPYFEAPGYSILVAANRELAFPAATLENLVLVALGVALAFAVAVGILDRLRRSLIPVVAGALGLVLLAWNLTGELYAAAGARASAEQFLGGFVEPVDWIDEATDGAATLYLGKQIVDQNGVHLLEFWNRSIEKVWSVDGSAPGPGKVLTPDLATADGELFPDPRVPYVVTDPGIDVVGELVAQAGNWRLFRVDPPLRLTNSTTGIFTDGWTSDRSGYSQFATSDGQAGTMRVIVSRAAIGATVPGDITLKVGRLVIGPDKQPALGTVTAVRRGSFEAAAEHIFTIPTPKPPFRVEVEISPTFVPAEVDPRSSDRRRLGAKVNYEFMPR